MALFNRNKTNQAGMAPEVNDYYKAEGRERTWVAWLLALATLLVTIFVVLGVFYGGRWAFRKLKGDDNKPTPVAVQTDDSKSSSQADKGSAPATSEPTKTESTTTTPAPSTNTTTPTTQTPSNSATKSDLPSTGPGDTLAVFMAVSIFGYFVHRRFLAKV